MPDNAVVIQLSAQDAEIIAAWQRVRQQGPQAMAAELDKAGKAGKKAGEETAGAFSQVSDAAKAVAGNIIGFTTATGAALTAARLLRAEWDDIVQRMKEAANRQVNAAGALKRAAYVATDIPTNELVETLTKNANGVDINDLALTLEAGISSAGDIPQRDVLASVLASTKLRPGFDLDSRQNLVTGSLTWQKAFGSSPEESMAGILQSFVAARTENVAEFSKSLAPAAAQLYSLGNEKDSPQYIMSQLIAFGQRMGDSTGRKTATNFINLARQVKEETAAAGLAPADSSLSEAFAAMQHSPELQAKMLGVFADSSGLSDAEKLNLMRGTNQSAGGSLSIEARAFVAAKEAIQSDQTDANATAREFRSAMGKVKGPTPAAVAEIEARNREVESSKYFASSGIVRAGNQAVQQSELLDVSSGVRESAITEADRARRKFGTGPFVRGLLRGAQRLSSATTDSDTEFLSGIAGGLQEDIDLGAANGRSGLAELQIVLDKINQTLEKLQADRQQPQQVIIAGDKRPDVPQRSSSERLNDRGSFGVSGSW